MYKPLILLNLIIITMILFLARPLSAQRIGSSKNAAERGLHRGYKYHENICNHNKLKVHVKSKNKFYNKNRSQESHKGRYSHKNSECPAWLNNSDVYPKTPKRD